MARQVTTSVENNFSKGLITEATALNFPENACTETYDCLFNVDRSVSRRLGFDFEQDYTTKLVNKTGKALTSYLWKNVSGDGDKTFLVLQSGLSLYFYQTNSSSISQGLLTYVIGLTPVTGAPSGMAIEAQFSDGNGSLIVNHPYCEILKVSYIQETNTFTSTSIDLKIRDFEGAEDPYGVDTRPPVDSLSNLDRGHYYNLMNQGWPQSSIQLWSSLQSHQPSNSDVVWRFRNADNVFTPTSEVLNKLFASNTPAPRGHFILSLANQDRNTISGLTGLETTTTGYQRPSTSAFFAGRIFYAGINYTEYNSNIYFTQIIERDEQYGFAYQVNDPTSEFTFDLLPSDGGVISIAEAGTIYKLFAIPTGLAVFAENGVWVIAGSTGIGFTATDYAVQKIAKVTTTSASSFVDVGGYPAWWNAEGIYTMSPDPSSALPVVKSLSFSTIKTFYDDIPLDSKIYARGVFNFLESRVQWLYRSTSASDVNDRYTYDRVLNLNTQTGAFYPWTIGDNDQVSVHGLFVPDVISYNTDLQPILVGTDTVIDGSEAVVALVDSPYTGTTTEVKYIVSYPSAGYSAFTFAETNDDTFEDWKTLDGVDYTSYFISGYRTRGTGLRKFQQLWVSVFSKILSSVEYHFQGLWDYASTGSATGEWSTKQHVLHESGAYTTARRRLKIRGRGDTLQFKVTSIAGKQFYIIGWATIDTINATP